MRHRARARPVGDVTRARGRTRRNDASPAGRTPAAREAVRGYAKVHWGEAARNVRVARTRAPRPHGYLAEYGKLTAFEAEREVDDGDGKGPHLDTFRHEFKRHARPSLDYDARGQLFVTGGAYTTTDRGVEDKPMYITRAFRNNPGPPSTGGQLVVRAAVATTALFLADQGLRIAAAKLVKTPTATSMPAGTTPAQLAASIKRRAALRYVLRTVPMVLVGAAAWRMKMSVTATVAAVFATANSAMAVDAMWDVGQKIRANLPESMRVTGAVGAGTDAYGLKLPAQGETVGAFDLSNADLRRKAAA